MDKMLSHKLAILCVKYIPVIVALTHVLAIILTFLNIGTGLLGCILGTSVISLVPMYIMSYAFKFCKYHRKILNYIVFNKIAYLVDYIFVIPAADKIIFMLYLIVVGVFLTLIIRDYLKYGDRNSA